MRATVVILSNFVAICEGGCKSLPNPPRYRPEEERIEGTIILCLPCTNWQDFRDYYQRVGSKNSHSFLAYLPKSGTGPPP